MTECPSCRRLHESQPRFCSQCGHQFVPGQPADAGPETTAPVPAGRPAGQSFALGSLDNRSAASKIVAVVAILSACGLVVALGKYSSQYSSKSLSARQAGLGETVVVGGLYSWPCGSSVAAFDELTKWAELHDDDEVTRTLIRTGSLLVRPGGAVKILDVGFGKRKVRVPTGRECWIASEAVTPRTPETCRDPHERLGPSGACFCEPPYHTDPTTLKCVQ